MTRRSRVLRLPLALALAATLTLAGCGDDEEPEADTTPSESPSATETATSTPSESPSESPSEQPSPTEDPAQSVDVTVKGDAITPMAQPVELGVGEKLVLNVTSDREGELHVHSVPEQEPAFKAGKSRIVLTFDKPGQVDVEEHESGSLILRVLVS